LLNLTLYHRRGLLNLEIGRPLQAENLHAVAKRGERVTQLVSQHRQELILAAGRDL
jgi:hypothetical protein